MRNKVTMTDTLARKMGTTITLVTAYDYSTAKLVEATAVDIILADDSLGMVIPGCLDTPRGKLDDLLHHFRIYDWVYAGIAHGHTMPSNLCVKRLVTDTFSNSNTLS